MAASVPLVSHCATEQFSLITQTISCSRLLAETMDNHIVNAFQVDDKSTTVTKITVILLSLFITLNIFSLKTHHHLPKVSSSKGFVLFASMKAL